MTKKKTINVEDVYRCSNCKIVFDTKREFDAHLKISVWAKEGKLVQSENISDYILVISKTPKCKGEILKGVYIETPVDNEKVQKQYGKCEEKRKDNVFNSKPAEYRTKEYFLNIFGNRITRAKRKVKESEKIIKMIQLGQ